MSNPEKVKLPLASSLQQVVGALLFGADHPLSVEEIRACLMSVAELDGAASETSVLFAEASPREISIARRRFSSISGPSTMPSSSGAGSKSCLISQ